jgi:hypothetical protein
MDEQERVLREALYQLTYGRGRMPDQDFLEREIIITSFGGCYGQAGVVVAINGSPPRALMLVTTDHGSRDAIIHVFRHNQLGRRPVSLLPNIYDTPGYKWQLRQAIVGYLVAQGVFDSYPKVTEEARR